MKMGYEKRCLPLRQISDGRKRPDFCVDPLEDEDSVLHVFAHQRKGYSLICYI